MQEKTYRSVINRLGVAMLVLFGGIALYRTVATEILPLLVSGLSAVAANVVAELVLAVLYALVFLAPVFVFYGISKRKPHRSFDAALCLPQGTLLYLFVALGIIGAAAHLNSYVIQLFDAVSLLGGDTATEPVATAPREAYQIVLAFISTAIVPAFVEEALFRGVVLRNLQPFGRTTAVFISALLFGIMHQNAAQLFYATVAGLVIGYIYAYTQSLWCCVLIHFCNNALSVFSSVFQEQLSYHRAVLADSLIYLVLGILGVLAALILLHKHRDTREDVLQNGCFERDAAPDAEYAPLALPMARRVRIFMTPPMVVFLALCAVQVLYMLGMAVLY